MTLRCLSRQAFCVIRGESTDIIISVIDDSGQPVDLAAASVEFGLAPNSSLGYIKTLSVSTSDNIITASIGSADYDDLPRSRYYFSCWVSFGSDSKPVARGEITIENDSRAI